MLYLTIITLRVVSFFFYTTEKCNFIVQHVITINVFLITLYYLYLYFNIGTIFIMIIQTCMFVSMVQN